MSGTPCSYVRSETATGDGEEIARLSNALQYEGKDALDRRLWQWKMCIRDSCIFAQNSALIFGYSRFVPCPVVQFGQLAQCFCVLPVSYTHLATIAPLFL